MKTILSPVRLTALLASVALCASCTTSYDAYGNPRQTVDPGVALAGVAAAGLVGYALSRDNDNHYHSRRTSYYGGGYSGYGGGYSGYGGGYGGGGYSSCY